MKRSRIFTYLSILILLGLSAALLSLGNAIPVTAYGPAQTFSIPEPTGNQCIGCHTTADPLIERTITWSGPVESLDTISCPALHKAQEELYLTDRLLLAIQRNQATLPTWVSTEKVANKLQGDRKSVV